MFRWFSGRVPCLPSVSVVNRGLKTIFNTLLLKDFRGSRMVPHLVTMKVAQGLQLCFQDP